MDEITQEIREVSSQMNKCENLRHCQLSPDMYSLFLVTEFPTISLSKALTYPKENNISQSPLQLGMYGHVTKL